ncbi:hypothetical protein Syun_030504 [Stephania yunnanensis]|uniref:Uncharacterized protein n=1 Tax=Stephania yunnanensis TaxID=152371 RepID=A0AAP0DU81_9MAGN
MPPIGWQRFAKEQPNDNIDKVGKLVDIDMVFHFDFLLPITAVDAGYSVNDSCNVIVIVDRLLHKFVSFLQVKITVVSVPLSLSESLRKALDEAFEAFYFIDERINVGNFEDRRRREVAKLLWNAGDLKVKKKDLAEHSTSVEDVLSTFEAVRHIAPEKLMITKLQIIREFVQDRECSSIEELCDTIYQLFADMSRWFLKQFVASILKEVHESAVEEYEERATFVLKLLYKLDSSLEDKVQWLFPDNGSTITAFFDTCENRDEGIASDAVEGDVADTMLEQSTKTCIYTKFPPIRCMNASRGSSPGYNWIDL